jgi:L-ascorbate metabolism protein UlaG (beta-lactamase superfamily)
MPAQSAQAQHDNVKITFIGHATAQIEMSGVRILTDPVFRKRFWYLRRRFNIGPVDLDLESLDAVLLSHMHFDHMDYPSLRMIPDHVPIIAPEGASRYLHKKVRHNIAEMRLNEVIRIGDVDIHATPSLHGSGLYWPLWFPKSVLSYMIDGPQTVYFVGDTALFDSMSDLGEDFDIDVALLPVWGHGPYLRGDHMTPDQAASALSMLSPRVAIPIHWGTLHPVGPWWKYMGFLRRPPHRFAREATRCAPSTDVRILHPGESTCVGAPTRRPDVHQLPVGIPEVEPVLAEPALA